MLKLGLRDVTEKWWGDNSARLERALGRAPTPEELVGKNSENSESPPPPPVEPPAVSTTSARRDAMVMRAALRASARANVEKDLLNRASEAFPDRVPDLEELDSWMDSLRPVAPHLFVPSTGSSSPGSGSFVPCSAIDRTPYLNPEEAGRNAERIAKGLGVW